MAFRSVFIALVIGTALLVAAFMINWYRPRGVTDQPNPALVRASGKCAECHSNMQYSVVHEYEISAHARKTSTACNVTSRPRASRARTTTASPSPWP